MAWIVIAVVAGFVAGALLVRVAANRRSPARSEPASSATVDQVELDEVAQVLEADGEIYLPTGRPHEFVVYGREQRSSGELVPADLARAVASSVSASLQGAVDAAKVSGRLVMVDGLTAKAIREGAMATDKAGNTLAVVRGASGKWAHMTRLTPAAGKVAGTALGAANVLSAISTQMQMAAIEAKLSEIVEGVQSLENIARRELDSSIYATRRLVEEVVGASRQAGHLPEQSWAMIAPHYKAIIEDQQMARGSVEDLLRRAEADPKGLWLGKKATALQTNRELLVERLQRLKEADLNVIRLHIVRLWHYTVVQPGLAPYFQDLARSELQAQTTVETQLLGQASRTISQHGELGRIESLFHWSKGDDFRRQIEEFSDFAPLARTNPLTIPAGSPPSEVEA